MQKRVTISIDENLNDIWGKLAKKHDVTKSGMVEGFLAEVLPLMDESTPNKMMVKIMKKMAENIDDTAGLFDQMSYDKSIEEYKEMKRG